MLVNRLTGAVADPVANSLLRGHRSLPIPAEPLALVGTVANQSAIEGEPFALDFSERFTGGARPLTYTLATGTLPGTLALNADSGLLSGAYPPPGTTSGLSVTATDRDGVGLTTNAFSITSARLVVPVAFNGTLPDASGIEGAAFSLDLAPYFSGSEIPFTYTAAADALPATLAITGSTVAGTYPAAKATLNLAFKATDAAANTATSNTFTLTSTSSSPVQFAGPVPAQSGTEGAAFSLDLAPYFTGAKTPFGYALASGTLPGTLSLHPTTGMLTGTYPAPSSTSGLSVRVTDALGDTATSNLFSITSSRLIVPVAFSGTIPDQSGTEGEPFSLDLAPYFDGTEKPFTFARASGAMSGTLALDPSTGLLSGTYPPPGTISGLSFRAVDTAGNIAVSNTLSIVSAGLPTGDRYQWTAASETVGEPPALLSNVANGLIEDWEIVADSAALGGQALRLKTSGTYRRLVLPGVTAPNTQRVDIRGRFYRTSASANSAQFALRNSGKTSFAGYASVNANGTIAKYINAAGTVVASTGGLSSALGWWRLRFTYDPAANPRLTCRMWRDDQNESTALVVTTNTLDAAVDGTEVGIGSATQTPSGTMFDWFTVGINGADAAIEPV